jgi:hypothetical protein
MGNSARDSKASFGMTASQPCQTAQLAGLYATSPMLSAVLRGRFLTFKGGPKSGEWSQSRRV